MKKRLIFSLLYVFLVFTLSINIVFADWFGYDSVQGTVGNIIIDQTTTNINSSDFWDDLDDPSDISGSQINNDLGWITSASGVENTSWNESHANDLYSGTEWGYNQTSIANTYTDSQDVIFNNSMKEYVDAQVLGAGGGNTSWNESHANDLYASIEWGYNQSLATFNMWNSTWDNSWIQLWDSVFNASFDDKDQTGSGNVSWNESYARDTFYEVDELYNKSEIDTNLSNYLLLIDQRFNETYTHLSNFTDDILWTSVFNNSFDDRDTGGADNVSWNESYANTVFITNNSEGWYLNVTKLWTTMFHTLTSDFEWTVTDDGSDMFMDFSEIGGTNSLFIETAGTFLEMIANPGPANDYEMFAFEETQGADTSINFYEGGSGHNRIWSSGSIRIGGLKDSSCTNLTADVDCDTSGTGADLVVQDDGWFGGKLFSSDWSNVSITSAQVSGGGADNVSWNESMANDLYLPHTVIWDSVFNASFEQKDIGGEDNVSWNESMANSLYSGIQWGYNQTTIANTYTDSQDTIFNDSITIYVDNQVAGVGGGNASWNESMANDLYVNTNGDNINGNLNVSQNISIFNRLGIGTESPESQMHIKHSGNMFFLEDTDDFFTWSFTTGIAEAGDFAYQVFTAGSPYDSNFPVRFYLSEGGKAGINTRVPSIFGLEVNGSIITNGNVTASYYNGDGSKLINLPTGNVSWNESESKLLHYLKSEVDTNLSNYLLLIDQRFNETYTHLSNFTDDILWTSVFNDSFDDRDTGGADNVSWNESHANDLYSGIEWGYNQTNTINYTLETFNAYNSTWDNVGGGGNDNTSWNESYANDLYAGIEWNYNESLEVFNMWNSTWDNSWLVIWDAVFNASFDDRDTGGADNTSWNESHAKNTFYEVDELYNKSEVDTNLSNYLLTVSLWDATFNVSFDDRDTGGSDNVSWNQSIANTLYSGIEWNYNQTNTINYTLETFNTYNSTWDNVGSGGNDNTSWNESIANDLYSGIEWGYNQTIDTFTLYNSTWDNSYLVLWDATFNVSFDDRDTGGADNVSWNQSIANDLFQPLEDQRLSTTDSPTFNTLNITGDLKLPFGACDTDSEKIETDGDGFVSCGDNPAGGNTSWNESHVKNILYEISEIYNKTEVDNNFSNYLLTVSLWDAVFNASFDDRDTGGADNVSWNQSIANTLYSPIQWGYNQTNTINYTDDSFNNWGMWWYNMTTVIWDATFNASFDDRDQSGGGNSSWNETYAYTLYAPNTTEGIQYLINSTNIYSTYNLSYESKVDYNLTENINVSEYNLTSVDCVVFKSGGQICSGT